LELLPVHAFVDDRQLVERGLRNYWGYNSIGFFAPEPRYSTDGGVDSFKTMVSRLHAAGIEVILDVVYNHTAEGNHLGPTLCYRGIDNTAYYRLVDDDPSFYYDTTGTGNTLLMRSPHVTQMIMDSLRYWVTEMHVDGFRFDLAASLARQFHEVDRLSVFFDLVHQDPVISQVKLIAEPWDLGPGGYQVGNFPPQWTEWNGKFRDTVRDYWRGEPHSLGEFAARLSGSSDLYEANGRAPYASVNFVTAHDGFTLRDLVSYNDKHNEANGEGNQDGESHNRSWNSGVEGETNDPAVLQLRQRQQRNMLSTLLLSQGVPMIAHGDELGRTQRGNNNVYCQDNEISWVHWDDIDKDLLQFTRTLLELRANHAVFRRRRFFTGNAAGNGLPDIAWLRADGSPMDDHDWSHDSMRPLAVFLNGEGITEPGLRGENIIDESFLLMLNPGHEDALMTVPDGPFGKHWQPLIDTSDASVSEAQSKPVNAGREVTVLARSVVMFRRV
ncbi:MAG: glycogen debranching protein GlgX, partial [Propionibacteriales bacterium]|nr:glycogen debranching protein GlgX [Propionibacteriales bacterium]